MFMQIWPYTRIAALNANTEISTAGKYKGYTPVLLRGKVSLREDVGGEDSLEPSRAHETVKRSSSLPCLTDQKGST